MAARLLNLGNHSETNQNVLRGWGIASSSGLRENVRGFVLKSTLPQEIELRFDPKIRKIERKLEDLENFVNELKDKVYELEGEELIIRDIPYSQAKKEIVQFFKDHHGENIDAADIEESLGIEFSIAMTICEELEKEGKIKEI